MATLIIADDEARELIQLLDGRLKAMLGEIAKTDDRAYRQDLIARHDRLESLRSRLDAATVGEQYFV
jgi:hypothetical protein